MHQSLFASFKVAAEGFFYALRKNRNMWIQLTIATVVLLLSLFFHIHSYQMGILGIVILLVLIAEMVNTSIEEMIDLITTERRKEAKAAKDVAAGMVLVTSVGAFVIGIIIFVPYIIELFRGSL